MSSLQLNSEITIQERKCCFCCFEEEKNPIMIHQSLCSNKVMLAIRLISFILLSIRFAVNLRSVYNSFFSILEFLTHFGLLFTIMFYVLLIWDFVLNQVPEISRCQQMRDIIVILYQIAICMQVPITVMYWWDVFYDDNTYTALEIIQNIGNHGLPLLCLGLDEIFNIFPVRTKDLIYVFTSSIIYLLMNLGNSPNNKVYTLKTKPIYITFDWISAKSYIYAFLALFLVGITHFVGQIIWYKCKRSKVKLLGNNNQQQVIQDSH